MIATKTLLLMVMGLAESQNGGRAKNCRVLLESWLEVLARVLVRVPAESWLGI